VSDYNVWLTEIRLRPSRRLLALLAAAHLGALAIALAMPLTAWGKAALALAISASMGHAIRRHALLHGRDTVVALKISRDGLQAETPNGVWFPTIVQDSTFVAPWLTVLSLKLPHRRLAAHVVLLPDMLTPDEFRRLRAWLRWTDARTHGKYGDAVL